MTDKNLKILSGMGIDPLESAPNYNVCLGNRGGKIMDNKSILTQAKQKIIDIQSDVAMIKHHAEKINGIGLADHAHLRELKRLLDKLGRDEIEYRAYMRIAEAMKDEA